MTKENDSAKLDDLLRRTQAAQDASARSTLPPPKKSLSSKGGTPANDSNTSGVVQDLRETAEDVRESMKFVSDLKTAFGGFKEKVLDPIWSVISPPFKFGWNCYKGIWNRFAYDKDKETGEKTISKTKAGILLAATFAAAVAATPTMPGEMVRYFTVDPVGDAISMSLTMKHAETVYNVKSHVIDADGGTYNIEGCHKPTACNAEFTKTFKLEERLSHTFWNMAENGHPFFMTDRIAAAIPQGNNKCEITSYSARIPIMKYLHIFPKALDVECSPMNGPTIQAPAPAPAG